MPGQSQRLSMRYQGGKSRIAKPIAQIIMQAAGGGIALSAYFAAVAPWKAKCRAFPANSSMTGTNTSLQCSKAFNKAITCRSTSLRSSTDTYGKTKMQTPVLAGFVGFGCSFGGKWFGGYARNKTGTNYAEQSKRSLLKDMATLQDAQFVCGDYRRLCIPPNSVIYADPPYNNTTGYTGDKFDTTEFWIAMRLLADLGHTVFVSEQEAPPDIQCIWEKPFTRTLDRNKGNQFTVTEKLFYLPPRRYTQHENGQSGILPK